MAKSDVDIRVVGTIFAVFANDNTDYLAISIRQHKKQKGMEGFNVFSYTFYFNKNSIWVKDLVRGDMVAATGAPYNMVLTETKMKAPLMKLFCSGYSMKKVEPTTFKDPLEETPENLF